MLTEKMRFVFNPSEKGCKDSYECSQIIETGSLYLGLLDPRLQTT